jgi:hypothetical protein
MPLDGRIALLAPAAFPQTWKGEIHYYTADAAGYIYAAPNDVPSLLRQGFRQQFAEAAPPATITPALVGSVEGEPPTTYPSPAPVPVEVPAHTFVNVPEVSDGQPEPAAPAGDASETGPVYN